MSTSARRREALLLQYMFRYDGDFALRERSCGTITIRLIP